MNLLEIINKKNAFDLQNRRTKMKKNWEKHFEKSEVRIKSVFRSHQVSSLQINSYNLCVLGLSTNSDPNGELNLWVLGA